MQSIIDLSHWFLSAVENSSRIFVAGLPEDHAAEKWELEAIFAPYGEVVDVWVARDPPGYAFLEFESDENATNAIAALHDTEAFGGTIRLLLMR